MRIKTFLSFAVVLALLVPSVSVAAIARDSCATLGFGASPHSHAFTVGSGTNRILFVYTWENRSASTITGVTYATTSMTKVNAGKTDGSSDYGTLWYQLAPASGANNVVITTSVGSAGGLAFSYSGAKQATPEASTTASANPGTVATDTLTTISANDWMTAGISSDAANAFTAQSGAVLNCADDAGVNSEAYDSNADLSAGTHSMTITSVSQRIQSVAAAFAPASAPVTLKKTIKQAGITH